MKKLLLLLSFLVFTSPLIWASDSFPSEAQARWEKIKSEIPIPPEQWVEIRAQKIKKARLVWVNREYFRKLGWTMPEKITAEVQSKLVKAFAYSIPGKSDPDSLFDFRDGIVGGADRYGGAGLGENQGSGRAFTFAAILPGMEEPLIVQSKGSGRTPLVKRRTSDHSNGAAQMVEGLKEALYGVLNSAELPLGSNQVIAIIDRGTNSTNSYNETMNDSIIIRENPIRPAHFMHLVGIDSSKIPFKEHLLRALPGSGENLVSRLKEYSRRIAYQFSQAFVLRLFHGAPSQSNVEISGRWLDFGTESGVNGYGKMKILDHTGPNGDFTGIRKSLVDSFILEVSERLGDGSLNIQERKQISDEFNQELKRSLREGFLYIAGFPRPIAKRLAEMPEGQKLGDRLYRLSIEGSFEYSGRYELPEKTSTYDVNRLLTAVGEALSRGAPAVSQAIQQEIPGTKGASLFSSYMKTIELAYKFAADFGISRPSLQTFISESSRFLNRDISASYRTNTFAPLKEASEKYDSSGEVNAIQRAVDGLIFKARRYDLTTEEFQTLVLDAKSNLEIFDAKKGIYYRSTQVGFCRQMFRGLDH